MAYPIFVLEGPDNGGKSTLARALSQKCGGVIIHSTYRFKGRMGQYHLAQFRRALKIAQTRPVIMDRWWPSEVAYGNTFRGGIEKSIDLELFQNLAKDYYVSYTFCMPTRWEEYWRWASHRWIAEEEMYKKDEATYHWLWMNYRELMLNHHSYYPQNLTQYYNVTIESGYEGPPGGKFAYYIMARMVGQLKLLRPDQKDLMNRMACHWKLVGRQAGLPPVPPREVLVAPPPPRQPEQLSLL